MESWEKGALGIFTSYKYQFILTTFGRHKVRHCRWKERLPSCSWTPWIPLQCSWVCSSSAPQWWVQNNPCSLGTGRGCLWSGPAGSPGTPCTCCVRRTTAGDPWRCPGTLSTSASPEASSPGPPFLFPPLQGAWERKWSAQGLNSALLLPLLPLLTLPTSFVRTNCWAVTPNGRSVPVKWFQLLEVEAE